MIIKGVIRRVRFGHDSVPPRVGDRPTMGNIRNKKCQQKNQKIYYTHVGYLKEENTLSQIFLKSLINTLMGYSYNTSLASYLFAKNPTKLIASYFETKS